MGIRRTVTKYCAQCNTPFYAYTKLALYCSLKCKQKAGRDRRVYDIQYHKRYYELHKEDKICKQCGVTILERKHGRQYCKTCALLREAESAQRQRDKVADAWHKFKIEQGCSVCGYNRNSAALEYHHTEGKDGAITAAEWYRGDMREIKKCILVCRNCHTEIHFTNRSNDE